MTDPTSPDLDAVRHRLATALRVATPAALRAALADIPLLLAEITRLHAVARRARIQFANLLAAARATLGAHRDGEPDPLLYLRDEIAAHESEAERR